MTKVSIAKHIIREALTGTQTQPPSEMELSPNGDASIRLEKAFAGIKGQELTTTSITCLTSHYTLLFTSGYGSRTWSAMWLFSFIWNLNIA